jgi:hypothetical protein
MGGGISLASPGHAYAAHAAGVAILRGIISSLHCNGITCNTGHAASAHAINADSFAICIAATEHGVIPSLYCTVISIAEKVRMEKLTEGRKGLKVENT